MWADYCGREAVGMAAEQRAALDLQRVWRGSLARTRVAGELEVLPHTLPRPELRCLAGTNPGRDQQCSHLRAEGMAWAQLAGAYDEATGGDDGG